MRGIFDEIKRDNALERLAIGIVQGTKNSVTVIQRINSISQNPEKYSNPSEYIIEWTQYLFNNTFHVFSDDYLVPLSISNAELSKLETCFFNYFISLIPFYFENKRIISPSAQREKFIWSKEDYTLLKVNIFKEKYKEDWNMSRLDNPGRMEVIDNETKYSLNLIKKSSRVKKSLWNKERKMRQIFFPEFLTEYIYITKPKYQHQYQTDIFMKYSTEFIKMLPGSFDKFTTNFYEVGTYLHKYFRWCKQ